MGIHDGHRDRLREIYLENGIEGMSEVNALELLLFYAIPRRDTNALAHALLDRFGSLTGVFHASVQELGAVPGVGERSAMLISLVPQLVRKARIEEAKTVIKTIRDYRDAGEYLVPFFLDQQDEIALLLCLDAQKRVLGCVEIGRGVINAVDVSIRKLVETAIKYRAHSVILAHNHPNGLPMASAEDDEFTTHALRSLSLVGIRLEDHIIVAGEQYASYRHHGMLDFIR